MPRIAKDKDVIIDKEIKKATRKTAKKNEEKVEDIASKKSTKKASEKSVKKTSAKGKTTLAEKVTKKSTKKTETKPAEKAAKKSTKKTETKPAEKAVKKSTKKAETKPAEKAVKKSTRKDVAQTASNEKNTKKRTKASTSDESVKTASAAVAVKTATVAKVAKTTTATKAPTAEKKAKSTVSKTTKKPRTTKTNSSKSTTTEVPLQIVEYYDLPYKYGNTIVKLLAQTPQSLFVYWEISETDIINFKKKYGDNFFNITKPVLIVHNLTLNTITEVEINDFANCWYLNVEAADCVYDIELARKFINKIENSKQETAEKNKVSYLHIATSNTLNTPNDHILFDHLQEWINFKNTSTNQIFKENIKSYEFLKDIHEFYKKMYNDEFLDNPSSKTNF